MRALVSILVVVGAACAPARPPEPVTAPRATPGSHSQVTDAPPRPHAAARPVPLPAGLYFGNSYVAGMCSDCPRPRAAVVAAISSREPELEAAVRRHDGERGLAPGFPWVAIGDELGLAREAGRGVVVLGLYASRAEATAAAKTLGARAIDLQVDKDAQRAQERSTATADLAVRNPDDSISMAVQIDEPRAAFDENAATKIDQALSAQWGSSLADHRARVERAIATAKPTCSVLRGRVTLASRTRVYRFSRVLAPTRCDDGRVAYVPWAATRLESIVLPEGADEGWRSTTTQDDPAYRLYQVWYVECDGAAFASWPFERGRRVGSAHHEELGCRG